MRVASGGAVCTQGGRGAVRMGGGGGAGAHLSRRRGHSGLACTACQSASAATHCGQEHATCTALAHRREEGRAHSQAVE